MEPIYRTWDNFLSIFLPGAGLFLGGLLAAAFLWRGRNRGVRRKMLEKTRKGGR